MHPPKSSQSQVGRSPPEPKACTLDIPRWVARPKKAFVQEEEGDNIVAAPRKTPGPSDSETQPTANGTGNSCWCKKENPGRYTIHRDHTMMDRSGKVPTLNNDAGQKRKRHDSFDVDDDRDESGRPNKKQKDSAGDCFTFDDRLENSPPADDTCDDKDQLESWESFQSKYLQVPIGPALPNDADCPICCEAYNWSDTMAIQLPCEGRHTMCFLCAKDWFSGTPTRNLKYSNTCSVCDQKLFRYDVDYDHYFEFQEERHEAEFIKRFNAGCNEILSHQLRDFTSGQYSVHDRWIIQREVIAAEAISSLPVTSDMSVWKEDITKEEAGQAIIAMSLFFYHGYAKARAMEEDDGIKRIMAHPLVAYVFQKMIELLKKFAAGKMRSNSLKALGRCDLHVNADPQIRQKDSTLPKCWRQAIYGFTRFAQNAIYVFRKAGQHGLDGYVNTVYFSKRPMLPEELDEAEESEEE